MEFFLFVVVFLVLTCGFCPIKSLPSLPCSHSRDAGTRKAGAKPVSCIHHGIFSDSRPVRTELRQGTVALHRQHRKRNKRQAGGKGAMSTASMYQGSCPSSRPDPGSHGGGTGSKVKAGWEGRVSRLRPLPVEIGEKRTRGYSSHVARYTMKNEDWSSQTKRTRYLEAAGGKQRKRKRPALFNPNTPVLEIALSSVFLYYFAKTSFRLLRWT